MLDPNQYRNHHPRARTLILGAAALLLASSAPLLVPPVQADESTIVGPIRFNFVQTASADPDAVLDTKFSFDMAFANSPTFERLATAAAGRGGGTLNIFVYKDSPKQNTGSTFFTKKGPGIRLDVGDLDALATDVLGVDLDMLRTEYLAHELSHAATAKDGDVNGKLNPGGPHVADENLVLLVAALFYPWIPPTDLANRSHQVWS